MFAQVKGAMGTILWCFVGIEAAVVLSERAISQKMVGKATVVSLLITLGIYVAVSVFAMGAIDAVTLSNASTPLADVLGATFIGGAGAIIVKLGLMTSVMGATLPWIMLVAEIPYVAAKGGVMPKWLAKTNENGIPINSLLLTQGLTQIFLLALLSDKLQSAYYMVYYISTTLILIPYLFSSLYSVKLCLEEKSYGKDIIISIIATVYAVYVVYAVGLLYLALTIVMYAIGVIPYYMAKREKGSKFTRAEIIVSILMILGAIYLVFQIAAGKITP
jgi:arginine:ornithine antiporter/lysine permease